MPFEFVCWSESRYHRQVGSVKARIACSSVPVGPVRLRLGLVLSDLSLVLAFTPLSEIAMTYLELEFAV